MATHATVVDWGPAHEALIRGACLVSFFAALVLRWLVVKPDMHRIHHSVGDDGRG